MNSTNAIATKMTIDSGAGGVSGILGLIGFLTVFFLPPVGILMLIIAGAMTFFKTKTVEGWQGSCPHCGNPITVRQDLVAANCCFCAKRFISRDGVFTQV